MARGKNNDEGTKSDRRTRPRQGLLFCFFVLFRLGGGEDPWHGGQTPTKASSVKAALAPVKAPRFSPFLFRVRATVFADAAAEGVLHGVLYIEDIPTCRTVKDLLSPSTVINLFANAIQ